MIDCHKSSTYHLESNEAMESFNKTLTEGFKNIYNIEKNGCDDKIPTILWGYRTRYKISTGQTPFKMVYA